MGEKEIPEGQLADGQDLVDNRNAEPYIEDYSEDRNLIIFKVSAANNTILTGDAIARFIAEGRAVELQAMGAGAVNQAIKGFARASNFLVRSNVFLVMDVFFRNVPIEGFPEEKTLMVFKLMKLDKMPAFPIRT